MYVPSPLHNYAVVELNYDFRKQEPSIFIYKGMLLTLIPSNQTSCKQGRIVALHIRLHEEPLTAAYVNMLQNSFCKVTFYSIQIPLYNLLLITIQLSINFSNYEKFHISLLHFLLTCHRSYCLKYQVVKGNTEGSEKKCLIKVFILKNVLKNHKKTPLRRFCFRAKV